MTNAPPPAGKTPPPADGRGRAERTLSQVNSSVAVLRTEADRARGLFGFGRRILVPPDEIHVVVGDGNHSFVIASERKVFGQTADRPSRYWLNALTQVIKLKTISFTVPIRGAADEGVEALDASKVSFRLWAHAVAKLNPDKAVIAAQRVGLDTTGLINTITEVGTAELIEAAATMGLEEIIANRQKLAEIAFPKVNQILSELGYDLALLTITQLDGMAYKMLIEQAEARISKETSIATNREQVAELQDSQSRARTEAEISAQTEKKLAAERLESQREVETATLTQQESLAISRHDVQVRQVERDKSAAAASHETNLAKVQLTQQLGQAEVDRDAQLARLKSEREAELRAIQQKRTAEIKLSEAQTEAERLALEQVRKIERAAESTQADARRLREEQLQAAERAKEVALVGADQLARSLEREAEGQARALHVKVDAETQTQLVKAQSDTKADLIRAEAEATATEKRALAAKVRADATRAEASAPGLAEAEVASARVQVAEKQVGVTRAEGLALVEVARAQAEADVDRQQKTKEVDINAQRQLAELYERAPVLVDLEKTRMQHAHQERLAALQIEAHLKAVEAIAPGVRINIYGNGGQAGRLLTDVLSFSQGLRVLGEEVPAVGRLLEGAGPDAAEAGPQWQAFMPYIRSALADVNPRVFSSLRVADLADRLGPVLTGREDLLTALNHLKQAAGFRVVGDLPVGPILSFLGVKLAPDGDAALAADAPAGSGAVEEGGRPKG